MANHTGANARYRNQLEFFNQQVEYKGLGICPICSGRAHTDRLYKMPKRIKTAQGKWITEYITPDLPLNWY